MKLGREVFFGAALVYARHVLWLGQRLWCSGDLRRRSVGSFGKLGFDLNIKLPWDEHA